MLNLKLRFLLIINFKELKMKNKKFVKFRKKVKPIIKYIAMLILFILAFIGIFRIFYLNTDCEGYTSYYSVEDLYAERGGFLNLKTIFIKEPISDVYCYVNFFNHNFTILKYESKFT